MKSLTDCVVHAGDGASADAFLEAELIAFCRALPDGEVSEDHLAVVKMFADKIVARRARAAGMVIK